MKENLACRSFSKHCRWCVGCFTLIRLNHLRLNTVNTEIMWENVLWSVSNKHSLKPVWLVMLISYYSANYQQLSPCQSSRWQILPISRLAVSSTGHELHVMETKSLALLTALTDKWGALEKLGPSLWAGEEKKTPSLPADLFFYSPREEIKYHRFCMYGLFPKYENY